MCWVMIAGMLGLSAVIDNNGDRQTDSVSQYINCSEDTMSAAPYIT